jgi:5-aminolevulinate synthase
MTYDHFFAEALMRLHEERRYRVSAEMERLAGRCPSAIGILPKDRNP